MYLTKAPPRDSDPVSIACCVIDQIVIGEGLPSDVGSEADSHFDGLTRLHRRRRYGYIEYAVDVIQNVDKRHAIRLAFLQVYTVSILKKLTVFRHHKQYIAKK